MNLLSLGHVDSLQFSLSSSDTGGFGMNTPAYFCMDNFTTNESLDQVPAIKQFAAKLFPDPAEDVLHISFTDTRLNEVTISDLSGRVVWTGSIMVPGINLNTKNWLPGSYLITVSGNGISSSGRFLKR